MSCIFCRIVDGEAPSSTVYEDETTMAFLDVNPLSRGHTLVIPKAHHTRLTDLPADLAADLYETLNSLVAPIESAVQAAGTTVAFNNGPAAGQEVMHVHGHIVPRFDDDGGGPIHRAFGRRPDLDDADLDGIAEAIRTAL